MVAPMTTYGPGQQVVWPVPYRLGRKAAGDDVWKEVCNQLETVNHFATEWREKYRGQWFETDRLGGGCVLLKRAALQAVGSPTSAPLQFFDSEAMSRRVKEAGFRLACCRDLFVHSFGSRGFETQTPIQRPPAGG
jgi:hypothetical protein